MIAALATAAGVYFTGRSMEAVRTQNAVAEQGQLTDRFTKAVDQLDRAGGDHLQARLGGIYALERLARDSPRDQPTVIEALSAFIRSTTPRPRSASVPGAYDACPDGTKTDVQAALTVLGRRNSHHDGASRIDLRSTCLPGADLHAADFTAADLTHANLYRADLTRANLARANLTDADLLSADLTRANLTGADLTRTYLVGTNLTETRHDERTVVNNATADTTTKGVWWR